MKIKLWFILAFCWLCFSLVTQPLFVEANSEQRQSVQQLHPNNTSALSESETEADSPSCTDDCINPQTSDQKTTSEIQNIIKAAMPKESCELLPTEHQLKDGKLSDYWAQEMIGADLLREEIEKAPSLPEDKFLVAVFDSVDKFSDHGIYVQNLISHDEDQAVLPGLNDSQIQFFQTHGASQYMSAVENITRGFKQDIQNPITDNVQIATEKLLSQRRIPSFINNSMNWEESRTIYEAMSKIHPPAILVKAAGNDYPWSLDPIDSQFSKNFGSILVGSLSPSGLVSDFSQEGEEVHILAPADNWITSVDNEGKYEKFGGTSGSAPLVTGSLAGFEWLSGYHPTPAEAKLLLEQTAIPTIHSEFEHPQRNGVGMLNAYKLGMVAKRLKEKCKKNDHCFKMEIFNPKNYEFPIDEENILEQTNKAFPQCSDEDQLQAISCADKKSAFKKLRQAVLLDIENISLLEKLHCVYTQEGFSENAFNVETAIAAVTMDEDRLWKLSHRNKIEAVKIAQRIRGKIGLEILKDSKQDSDPNVKMEVAIGAGLIGGTEGSRLLKDLALDPDASVRSAVAIGAGLIGGTEGSRLLKDLALDPDASVRSGVVIGTGDIGGKEGSEILQVLYPDPNVRKQLIISAQGIKNVTGLKILRVLEQDPDPEIRSIATETILEEFLD